MSDKCKCAGLIGVTISHIYRWYWSINLKAQTWIVKITLFLWYSYMFSGNGFKWQICVINKCINCTRTMQQERKPFHVKIGATRVLQKFQINSCHSSPFSYSSEAGITVYFRIVHTHKITSVSPSLSRTSPLIKFLNHHHFLTFVIHVLTF